MRRASRERCSPHLHDCKLHDLSLELTLHLEALRTFIQPFLRRTRRFVTITACPVHARWSTSSASSPAQHPHLASATPEHASAHRARRKASSGSSSTSRVSASCTTACTPSRRARCCSCSREWMRRGRTARSGASSAASTRRAAGCSRSRRRRSDELAHDYLWRIHNVCPARGEIVIFNRSHYEDIVAVRVRKLAAEAVWQRRHEQIREFERMLTDEGTTIVKVFLHLSLRRAAHAAARAARRSREAMEVPGERSRRPRQMGRIRRRLRGRAARDVDRLGALVRRSRRSQLVA